MRQTKGFSSLEAEAYLNLYRTADVAVRATEELLKPVGLTQSQYNVLRILRGAGEEGLTPSQVSERLLTRDPDVTRLIDRLGRGRLVTRRRDQRDRRAVTLRITNEGVALLKRLDEPAEALPKRLLGHLGARRLRLLIGLLEEARAVNK